MTSYPDLLPPNSTPLERALAGPTGRLLDVPVPIDLLWRWDTCPAPMLPWLAWALSVDFWDETWTEARKRNIIRESFELHRKKGTLYGIRRYLRYADAELYRAITPPDKAYAIGYMSAADRKAWLDRFPQIRIYNWADRGTATKGAFCKGAYGLAKTFLGAGVNSYARATCFPHITDAFERWGRRPFLWDQGPHPLATGEFRPIRWSARGNDQGGYFSYEFERIMMPVTGLNHLWLGKNVQGNKHGQYGRWFLMPSRAAKRIVTVNLLREYEDRELDLMHTFAVPPSLNPINIVPEKVAERGTSVRGKHIFAGAPGRWLDMETRTRKRVPGFVLGYLPPTGSRYRLYDLFALHDKERMPGGKPATRHLGHIRLGMPPYHAELAVAVHGNRSVFQTNKFLHGHLMKSDLRHLHNARKAIISAKSDRDKIWMHTTLHKPAEVSAETKVSSTTSVGRATLLLT